MKQAKGATMQVEIIRNGETVIVDEGDWRLGDVVLGPAGDALENWDYDISDDNGLVL
jgi:hypothetical protein